MKRLLTVKETAELLATTPGNIYDWIKNGQGPEYVKIGRSIRYDLEVIEEWVDMHRVVPPRSHIPIGGAWEYRRRQRGA